MKFLGVELISMIVGQIVLYVNHIFRTRTDRNLRKALCGDCTGRPYQLTKAVGEGNIAAHSVLEYLDELEKAQNNK